MRFIRLPGLWPRTRRSVSADVDAEIASHIERTTELLIAHGWTHEAARAEALRRFGDMGATRDVMYSSALRQFDRARRRDFLDNLVADARYIGRQLLRTPGFTLAVIGTLALGIGANATMFGVLDRLLLRPPAHVRDPDRVSRVYLHRQQNGTSVTAAEVSYFRLAQLRDGASAATDLAGFSETRIIVGNGAEARQVRGALASSNFWTLLGVRPLVGRFFDAGDDGVPDGAAVAVLGHEYWRAAYGGDTSVIGKAIEIAQRRFTIIGIAPAEFTGPGLSRVDLWIPATASRAVYTKSPDTWQNDHSFVWLSLIGRQRPGVTREQTEALLTATYRRSLDAQTRRENPTARASLWPLLLERGPERGDTTRVALWLGAVACIVLLLACANVANLLLARALQRRGEIAIRLALGISRGRLIRQLLLESVMLVGLGAIAGVALAALASGVFRATLFPGVEMHASAFDRRILVFAFGAAAIATLLSGLGPALYASREDVRALLTSGTRTTTHRSRLRASLLVSQAGLSTVLLVGAGLFVRSLESAASTDLGFDADHLLVVRVDMRSTAPVPGGMAAIYRQFAERVRALPGVRAATTTVQIPFSISGSTDIQVPGVDSVARFGEFLSNAVGEDYFETTGTRILQGRALTRDDIRISQPIMVVSDSMARVLWPRSSALGKCVKLGGLRRECFEVVGVAANVHQYSVRVERSLQYWYPEATQPRENDGPYAALVRVTGDPASMVTTIRQAVLPLAPTTAHVTVRPVAESVHNVIRPWRLGAVMFGVFGGLGLLIAAVGLYSVLAYSVGQRRREIGIRSALGARRASVLAMVVLQGIRLTAIGVFLGLVVTIVTAGRLAPLLLGVGPRDPFVLSVVVVTLVVVAILASAIPAWRAARVDPASALRDA